MFHRMRRSAVAALTSVVVAAGAVVALAAGGPASGAEGFYQPPAPLPAGRDGDVIRSEPVEYLDGGATATRIMYLSRNIRGEQIPVTGLLLVPDQPWTGRGPRPLVAYGSATVGAGDECALSRTMAGEGRPDSLSDQIGIFINPLLERGMAVVVTDYEGMGTPGEHTFMIREPQGYAVLDALRAAQRLRGTGLDPRGPVAITGYSQGAAAAASAAELAADHAPDLNLLGVYAGATPTDIAAVARQADRGYAGGVVGLAVLAANAAYPELEVTRALNSRGLEMLETIRDLCTMEIGGEYLFLDSRTVTRDGRSLADHLARAPYDRIAREQEIGHTAPAVPVLVEHPLTDDLVPYRLGRELASDWCEGGATVEFRTIHNLLPFLFSHVGATETAAGHSAEWLTGRFNGRPARSTCGSWF
ncbi:lipase family protein [Streptomyces sp. DSM 44917]|uniref:Lipase family protein n=1 Tax=Streptomyces boetiae TaxID=3075541 RepID=A0ABU2LDH1_9ACTN|nr:lipase family protein [Streptomyces sp. DSM 44917]MDT0309313.1 lipase family protein [Streptomyces sp. DSM 44917]